MSVLFKALQRAEKSRAGGRAASGGDEVAASATPEAAAGMPAVGAGGGDDRASLRARIARAARDAARRGSADAAPLSTGRRVVRLLGLSMILLLASAGAAMVLFGEDLEMVLADILTEPAAPRVAQPRPAPAAQPVAPATPDPAPQAAAPVATPAPAAEAPEEGASAPTTNIAALMEAGRRARGEAAAPAPAEAENVSVDPETADPRTADEVTPAPPVEPAGPPEPRGLADVLAAEDRARAAAPLKPPVAVERREAARAGAPEAEVEVTLQAAEARDAIAASYRALMRGDYHTALEGYETALDSDPRSLPALLGKAAALHKMRRLDEARQAYEAVLGLEPGNREALTNLADIIALSTPQEALQRLTALRAQAPEFGPVAAQLALLHARLGNAEAALREMGRAVALEPGNVLYRYNLAILQDRAGDRAAAAASYRQVLDAMSAGASVGVPRAVIHDRLRYLTSPLR